jgi:hypothetical protein
MSLGKELLELLTVILPLIVAVGPFFLPLRSLPTWVITILITATTSVVSTGLLMMRSLATCFDTTPQCTQGAVAISHLPGLFERYQDCVVCAPQDSLGVAFTIASWINRTVPALSIGVWLLCSLLSLWTVGRFIRWFRAQRFQQSR